MSSTNNGLEPRRLETEWSPDGLFDLLGDRYAVEVLRRLSREPMSAKKLARECDGSLSTVYRRLRALKEYGLLKEETRIEDGTHYKVYRNNVEQISIKMEGGEVEVESRLKERASDGLADVWNDLRYD